jgi:hypothetical protein
MTLRADLVAAVTQRLELARAAQTARPGPWRAVPTHNMYGEPDGGQRVLAEDPTPTGFISRMVVDVPLHPVDSKARHEVPADTAAHIVVNDPATVIRACEADLERLAEHRPMVGDPRWCVACTRDSGIQTAAPCAETCRVARVHGFDLKAEAST